MSAVPKPKLTTAEYLAIERRAEFRSEYYRGEMFAMAGTTLPHTRITVNLSAELHSRFKGTECVALTQDLRVKVSASGLYTYPDVVIYCGEPELEHDAFDTFLNPRVIIEVLSPSTERYDRGLKFQLYQELPSLQEYVLVSQDKPLVEAFARQDDGRWLLTLFPGLAGNLTLASVARQVPSADVYSGVTFPESPTR